MKADVKHPKRSRAAESQRAYRRRQKTRTTAEWVDCGEQVFDALAQMPGGNDPGERRECLSELLTLGAAWYLAELRKKTVKG
jgi:hypothetical protein